MGKDDAGRDRLMSTLRLTLKWKWWHMIATGQKLAEYREIKPFWTTRLKKPAGRNDRNKIIPSSEFRQFDVVEFTHGYGKNQPTIRVQCLGLCEGTGAPRWGATEGKRYYIIRLGKVLETRNWTPDDPENCPECQMPMKPKKSWGGLMACYCRWGGKAPSAKQLEELPSEAELNQLTNQQQR